MKAIAARHLALLTAGTLLLHGCAPLLSRVDSVPADAEISVNGHYAGTGTTTLPDRTLNGYGPARSFQVKLEAPSFKTYEATISSRPEPAMYAGAAASLGGAAYFIAQYLRTGRQDGSFNDEINLAGATLFAALTYFLTFHNQRLEPTYQFDMASRQVTHPPQPEIAGPIKGDPGLKDIVTLYEQIQTLYDRKADMAAVEKGAIRALFDGSGRQAEPYLNRVDSKQPLAAFRQAYQEVAKTQSSESMSLKAVHGMLDALKEPTATYLPARPPEDHAGRLGLSLAMKGDQLIAVQVLTGSPAEESGIRRGDRILAVNGKSVAAMPPDERPDWTDGPVGSKVTMAIRRNGKTLTLTAPHSEKRYAALEAMAIPPGIGYLRLNWLVSSFYAMDLERSLEIVNRGRGLILDLRGTQGGSLYDVKVVGSMLLKKGNVARNAGRMPEALAVSGKPALAEHVPMVLLVDAGTRGPAEVLAGSLQEAGRARVLGEPSFGDTRFHAMIPLANGDRVQLPMHEGLTGAGRRIHGMGLQPDILVAGDRSLDAAKDLLIYGLSAEEVRSKYGSR